jgi:hypothetical protein
MAGGRLEVFKFGLYLLLPAALIVHLKKPEWYTNHVDPVSSRSNSVRTIVLLC